MKIYDTIGASYRSQRVPDHRIEARIHEKIQNISSLLNIGAGTGSYEPTGIRVVGLEPSGLMIRNRPETAAPCVMGAAESLPFKADSFDACLGILTIHHWIDWKRGIQEALRVCRKKLILLTWDPNAGDFWLTKDYLPEIHASDSKKFPSIPDLKSLLGDMTIDPLSIPANCSDGFMGAYWQRPEAYLTEERRKAISSLSANGGFKGLIRLEKEIADGTWENKYGGLRNKTEADLGYKLIVKEK